MRGDFHAKTAITSGCALALTAIALQEIASISAFAKAVAFTFGALEGGLLPDIDNGEGELCEYSGLGNAIESMVGHRKKIHTIPCGIGCMLPFFVIGFLTSLDLDLREFQVPQVCMCIGYGVLYGFVLHLVQDSFTKEGVMLFYPFSKNYISFGKMENGSSREEIIGNLIVVLSFIIQGIAFYIILIKGRAADPQVQEVIDMLLPIGK